MKTAPVGRLPESKRLDPLLVTVCIAVGGSAAVIFQILLLGPWIRLSSGKKIRILAVRPNLKDMIHIAELCEAGKVVPVIDRRYSLAETAEAIRYLGEGRSKERSSSR